MLPITPKKQTKQTKPQQSPFEYKDYDGIEEVAHVTSMEQVNLKDLSLSSVGNSADSTSKVMGESSGSSSWSDISDDEDVEVEEDVEISDFDEDNVNSGDLEYGHFDGSAADLVKQDTVQAALPATDSKVRTEVKKIEGKNVQVAEVKDETGVKNVDADASVSVVEKTTVDESAVKVTDIKRQSLDSELDSSSDDSDDEEVDVSVQLEEARQALLNASLENRSEENLSEDDDEEEEEEEEAQTQAPVTEQENIPPSLSMSKQREMEKERSVIDFSKLPAYRRISSGFKVKKVMPEDNQEEDKLLKLHKVMGQISTQIHKIGRELEVLQGLIPETYEGSKTSQSMEYRKLVFAKGKLEEKREELKKQKYELGLKINQRSKHVYGHNGADKAQYFVAGVNEM